MDIKIGHKIAFIYSAITVCAAGLVFAVLYYWMSDYTENLYYSFLEERAYLIAEKKAGKSDLQEPCTDCLRTGKTDLHGQVASQLILDASNEATTRRELLHLLSPDQVKELYRHGEVEFKHADSLGVAVYYPRNEGNFIVIVRSNQHFGNYMHRQLGYWIMGIVALCMLMVYLVSKLYALHRINALDEAYRREKQFIHHASHELNNPLTAIQGECEITLLKERSPREYEEALTRIGSEAGRMVQTIRQLLYLSEAMEGMKGEGMEYILLRDFLPTLSGERVCVSIDSPDNKTAVNANPFLLKMAVGNLLSNALKYSSGKVELTLSGTEVSIADRGIGIPEDELKYVSQPFYRASNTRTYKGNGIGFSLASRILQVYGIRMRVSSKVGKGTTVLLDFTKADHAAGEERH